MVQGIFLQFILDFANSFRNQQDFQIFAAMNSAFIEFTILEMLDLETHSSSGDPRYILTIFFGFTKNIASVSKFFENIQVMDRRQSHCS